MSSEPVADEATALPLLKIVRGTPSAEELAALVAVIAAAGGEPEPRQTRAQVWSHPSRMHRRPITDRSPSAWVRSFR